jgi:glutathione S-transferase
MRAPRAPEALHHVGELLAERGRRGRLAVRARDHGLRRVPARKLAQRGDERVQPRQHHLLARLLQHQRVGQVVDVLRGAGEVDEFERALHFPVPAEPGLQPVLDRLDVVVGAALDIFYFFCLFFIKIQNQLVQGQPQLPG